MNNPPLPPPSIEGGVSGKSPSIEGGVSGKSPSIEGGVSGKSPSIEGGVSGKSPSIEEGENSNSPSPEGREKKARLLLAYHPLFLAHDTGPGHPEHPERVEAVMEAVRKASWHENVDFIEPREATPDEVELVHDPKYVDAIRRLCEAGGEFLPTMECSVGPESYPAALRAAGAGLTLADAILRPPPTPPCNSRGGKRWSIGFAPTRPPGHHAVHDRPMGFCMFNNIAILARYLLTRHNLTRIGILDFDVHHGNGTEAAFWRDPRVLFCSLHRDNFYPYNRGRRADRGEGDGEGFTLNVPLPAGSGDDDYLKAIDRYAIPAFEDFDPQMVLVSAGFDTHWNDPLGGMRVTGAGYASIAERVLKIASGSAEGRIITLLEGGYSLSGLAEGVTSYLGRLLEG